jgi:3-mercaptopyruvate sulfurtransferase SseA
MVAAPVTTPSPTTPRPTATFVPLITPSSTPEGGALTRSLVPRIEVKVARQMADAGDAVLVDVRTKATFEQAHIVGALSMPSSEVLDRYQELPTDKLVIFY